RDDEVDVFERRRLVVRPRRGRFELVDDDAGRRIAPALLVKSFTIASRAQPIPRLGSSQEDRAWRVPHATSVSSIRRTSSAVGRGSEAAAAAAAYSTSVNPAAKRRRNVGTLRPRYFFGIAAI